MANGKYIILKTERLEDRVKELEKDNRNLTRFIDYYKAENKKLKEQILELLHKLK